MVREFPPKMLPVPAFRVSRISRIFFFPVTCVPPFFLCLFPGFSRVFQLRRQFLRAGTFRVLSDNGQEMGMAIGDVSIFYLRYH